MNRGFRSITRKRWGAVWPRLLAASIFVVALFLAVREAPAAEADHAYLIGLGDVLRVEVPARADLSGQFPVGPDGNASIPVLGSIRAVGRTATDLAAELSRRFSLYDRDIRRVNVSVAEYKSQVIYILGAVLRPGKYTFAELPTIWDAIGEAGGPTEDAQLSAVQVIPSDSMGGVGVTTVDVAAALRDAHGGGLARLRAGDTVRVPRGLIPASPVNAIFVFGAIATQGTLPLDQAPDLVTAIVRSGGPTPDANLAGVEIVRKSGGRILRMKVNLRAYFSQATESGDPPLEAGDTVFVPHLKGPGTGDRLATLRLAGVLLSLVSAVVAVATR